MISLTLSEQQYQPPSNNSNNSDHPRKLADELQSLSFRVWSKNIMFISKFISSGEFEHLLGIIRPRGLDHISCKKQTIEIKLYQEKEPIEVLDMWPSVLRGLASKVISDTFKTVPTIIQDVLNQNPWIPDRLCQMLDSSSPIEKYGAMSALESVYWSGVARKGADLEYLIPQIMQMISMACESHRGLLNTMRWRLAYWRVCFDMLNTLCCASDFDLFNSASERGQSQLIQLRRDWMLMTGNGKLVLSILKIFKFAHLSIPKVDEERFATVFSGPGVFKGSGLRVKDLEPTLRSACFILKRLTLNDEFTKGCLMHQSDYISCLKTIGGYLQGAVKIDIVDLLLHMGVNNPVCYLGEQLIIDYLKSGDPREIFKALRILANDDHLVDAEKWEILSKKYGIEQILLNIAQSSFSFSPLSMTISQLNEKLSNVRMQMDPCREIVVLHEPISWKTLLKCFSSFITGRRLIFNNQFAIAQASKDVKSLVDLSVQGIKTGCDLEKWSLSGLLAGILTQMPAQILNTSDHQHRESLMFVTIKLFKFSRPFVSGGTDLQFLLETWLNGSLIIKAIVKYNLSCLTDECSEALTLFFEELNQIGIVPLMFEVLKEIAVLHKQSLSDEQPAAATANGLQKQKSKEIPDAEHCYRNDFTLTKLICEILNTFILLAEHDSYTKDILLWESNLCTMEVYMYFANADVNLRVTRLFETLVNDLKKVASVQKSSIKTVKQKHGGSQLTTKKLSLTVIQAVLRHRRRVEAYWPPNLHEQSLIQHTSIEDLLNTKKRISNGLLQSKLAYERENEPYIHLKVCGNAMCMNRENRLKQFRYDNKSEKWYCCRGCISNK